MSSLENITLAIDGGVGTITVQRPAALNALNRAMLVELKQAMNLVKANEAIRVVVLTGAGTRAFVAGADISELALADPLEALKVAEEGKDVFDMIERLPKPTIAAINGIAAGGGLEFALSCDFRIAAATARLGLPEVNLGLLPGWGGTQRLQRLVGFSRAKRLILLGELISAEQALGVGLVDQVVPQEHFASAVADLAASLLRKSPVALSLCKAAIHAAASLDAGMTAETRLFGLAFTTQDSREGLDAFTSKRKPVFTGK
ncbi:MAG: hypothetical protein HPY55_11170 [Firmicutes bacterium]|nr:hypothetical protein [Bacillota bacterium]